VAGLPEEISLALADIAVVAKDRLLAMSVAAGDGRDADDVRGQA
jgi:hypothetical protein